MLLFAVAVAVTGTWTTHVVAPATAGAGPSEPPVSVTEFAPVVTTPPQVVVAAPAIVCVPASVSVNVIGESVVWLKLLIVIVSVDVPPGAIGFGANALVIAPPVCTVTLAWNCGLVTPSAVVSAPAATVLVTALFCAVVGLRAMTSTVILQKLLAGMVPPVSAMVAGLVAGDDAVAVPAPQVVVAFAGVAMVTAAGSESVIAAFVSGTALGLVSVIVSVENDVCVAPLPCTTVGANALPAVIGSERGHHERRLRRLRIGALRRRDRAREDQVEVGVRNRRNDVDRDPAGPRHAADDGPGWCRR